jgi:hypothetical protein
MSIQLPTVDLTGAIVGQKFTVDFTAFVKFNPQGILRGGLGALNMPNSSGISPNAHLEVFNESGCGLDATMKASGITFYVPAGKWGTANIAPNDSTCELKVRYILPNPPVSLLTPVYYEPGEEIPSGYTLGNSPIGIGGTVQTSSVQTLSNEGGTSSLVIDIGDATFPQLLTIFQDGHALWSVDQTGTKHQAIKINASGTPLQLGQAADITEILGILQPDGNINAPAATDIVLNVPTSRKVSMQVNAVEQAKVDSTGITLPAANKFFGNEIDSLAATDFVVNVPSGQSVRLRVNGVDKLIMNSTGDVICESISLTGSPSVSVLVGSLSRASGFSGTGNGTVNTNLGTTPFRLFPNPCTASGSSQTIGMTNAQSTVVTTGAGLAWHGFAWL